MADRGLFSRLQRLFSTDVVIRNAGGNQLKVFDVSSIQKTGDLQTNALVDRFNRIYTNSGTSLYGQQTNFNYQYLRPSLYSDYDAMDTDAIIASDKTMINKLITIQDAAKLLGVNPETLRRWDRKGKYAAKRHPINGYRLYNEKDIKALMGKIQKGESLDG